MEKLEILIFFSLSPSPASPIVLSLAASPATRERFLALLLGFLGAV
uniref:Uncharacterized protein n=1 Tax=Arundo donax TaxID=35708 RepID=A0A0A9HFJ6_ARUDO